MADAPARIKQGPLSGKRVGLLAGPEFSDFQAYYLNLYLSELGARVCNLVIGWPEVGWKMTRPATSDTVQGTFGLRLDPIPTMAHGDRYTTLVFRDQAQLSADFVGELDTLIVLGGHSADVLRVDPAVTGFVSSAYRDGVLVGALECGQMVLMSAGVIDGQQVTGYRVVPLADLGLDDFDAVMIPGAFCPWNCLDDGSPVELCRRAAAAGKVVTAICHGPLVLAAADLVDGRRIAGFTACRDDVITMGARYDFAWPAMIDGNIVTGRVPDDVPEFVDAITDALSGSRRRQAATPAFAEAARAAP